MRRAIAMLGVATLLGCSRVNTPSVLPVQSDAFTTPLASGFRTIFRFSGKSGTAPVAGLTVVDGDLYGTTESGGEYNQGTVFRISPSGAEKVIHSFKEAYDGLTPLYGPLLAIGNTLYGTTENGGAHGDGTVFEVTTSGNEKVIYSFKGGTDGAKPWGGLIAVHGMLYGTTYAGGTGNNGTVFKVTTSGAERVLHTFKGGGDGATPLAGLANVNGTLFGTTKFGGVSSFGVVFKISTSGKERVIHSFLGAPANDGANPTAPLINVGGTLYGTTLNGGNSTSITPWGTVFSISTSGVENVLHSFANGQDGANPLPGNLMYIKGALYGTTTAGGSTSYGVVFKITTSGSETVLHVFSGGRNGQLPYGAPVELRGRLYGITFEGGDSSSTGTAYSMHP